MKVNDFLLIKIIKEVIKNFKYYDCELIDDKVKIKYLKDKLNHYNMIKIKDNYDELLKFGMFFEFFPELTGNWNEDQEMMK